MDFRDKCFLGLFGKQPIFSPTGDRASTQTEKGTESGDITSELLKFSNFKIENFVFSATMIRDQSTLTYYFY